MGSLSDNEKWQVVVACDTAYDGRFFYGVVTTGIFCRPSCKSRPPRRENTVFFASASVACAQGYRPCKRCRPDTAYYAPARETVRAACALLEREYAAQTIITDLPGRVGLSRSHFARLFKHHTGYTPTGYLHAVRVRRAERLLAAGRLTGIQIAYEVGYNSPSRFFAAFRTGTGLSPGEWRRRRGGGTT